MLPLSSLRSLAPLLWAALLPSVALAQGTGASPTQPSAPRALTLEAALAEAFARSPALAAAAADVGEARGRLLAARTLPYNPDLEFGLADRAGPGGGSTDRGAALTQQLEIGGQRSKRMRVAELELASVEARFQRIRHLLAASVAIAFAEAVAAEDLAELAATEAELAREMLDITRRRFEAGAANQVDLNLAMASTARAERRGEVARAVAIEARSLLAEQAGLDPAALPELAGPLALPAGGPAPLAALVEGALQRRADLAALRQARQAAEARLRLAKAGRIPDLSVGAFYEEEEGTDRIFGGGIGISLPLFNRNQGEIAEAKATLDRAAAESAAQELEVRREVFSALARYEAARTSAEKLGEQMVGSLAESLDLLERSFTAGKIGLSDLLVFRRELIGARQEHVEATTEAWIARIALDLAAGRLPGPESSSPAPSAEGALETVPSPETYR